jgi:hypothetical protein
MSKNTTYRITVTLPLQLRDRLEKYALNREVSQVVTKALENYFIEELKKEDPIQAFLEFRKNLPRQTYAQTRKAIDKGRA